jgi:hypothetical protein
MRIRSPFNLMIGLLTAMLDWVLQSVPEKLVKHPFESTNDVNHEEVSRAFVHSNTRHADGKVLSSSISASPYWGLEGDLARRIVCGLKMSSEKSQCEVVCEHLGNRFFGSHRLGIAT